MARGFQGAVLRGFGARDHAATVLETTRVAPHVIRVTLSSPTLFQDAVIEPAAWLRFWFPDADGSGAEHQRAYTIIDGDAAAGVFTIDVVLHEPGGPACRWATTAKPGATIAVMSLMGSSRFEPPSYAGAAPAGYLLIGDSASIPGMNAIIGTVRRDVPIEMYLEQHDDDDPLIPITQHPRLRVHWVQRRDAGSLAAAIEARDWANWYAWATPEAGALKHVRARLRDEFGFPRSEIHAQAYWNAGRAMGVVRNPAEDLTSPAGLSTPVVTSAPSVRPARTTAQVTAVSVPEDAVPEFNSTPTPAVTASSQRWRARAAGRLLAPLRVPLILSGAAQAVVTLTQLAPFVLLVELARLLVTGAETSRMITVGMIAVGLLGLGTSLAAGLTLWLHIVDARFARNLRSRLLTKMARLPLGWFDRGSGSVKQLVSDDTLALHYLVTHAVPDAIAAVVAPVAVLVYLFTVDWRVALVLFIPVLLYLVTASAMTVASGGRIAQAQRWAETMNTEAGAYLAGQPVIRIFGGTDGPAGPGLSRFRRTLDDYIGFLLAWQRPLAGKKTRMDLITRPSTFLWLIMAIGTGFICRGSMDPVNLLPFLLLGTTFGAQLLGIAYGLGGIRTGLLAARRLQVTLDEPELTITPTKAAPAKAAPTKPVDVGPTAAHSATARGEVVLDRIRFGYRRDVPVIHDVSLRLQPGTLTALVGPSGSGKSTLAALAARFYDVDAGAIRIDGRDIRELTADELYRRIGFVLQQTQLVHGTVRDNIALAVPEASLADIESAAQAAQIHDRILRLPNGYDTILGPDAALSGGERQRLTIARALLADTPVLVLDEATAFADPESEYLVQQALNRLTANRTVLVIAHRLHTVIAADQIVVLDHGRIAEIGTHEELLDAGGLYRRLWQAGQTRQAVESPLVAAGKPAQ